jgi:hypothetical protein
MSARSVRTSGRDLRPLVHALPVLVAAVAVVVAGGVALARGAPFPVAVASVLLIVGILAALVAWSRPWRGAIFVAALAAVVLAVLYGG